MSSYNYIYQGTMMKDHTSLEIIKHFKTVHVLKRWVISIQMRNFPGREVPPYQSEKFHQNNKLLMNCTNLDKNGLDTGHEHLITVIRSWALLTWTVHDLIHNNCKITDIFQVSFKVILIHLLFNLKRFSYCSRLN